MTTKQLIARVKKLYNENGSINLNGMQVHEYEGGEGDCYEDHIADVLLNGGEIYIYDAYSEGEVYSKNGELIKEEYGGEEYAQYTLTLTDIIEGLQRAANGTYNTNNDTKFVRQCFNEFADKDCCDLDLTDADALMQVITFNELIYG